jgi:hypothetical protein
MTNYAAKVTRRQIAAIGELSAIQSPRRRLKSAQNKRAI